MLSLHQAQLMVTSLDNFKIVKTYKFNFKARKIILDPLHENLVYVVSMKNGGNDFIKIDLQFSHCFEKGDKKLCLKDY